MTCTYDSEALALYAHDDLMESEKQETEAHVKGCDDCRSRVAEYRLCAEAVANALKVTSVPSTLTHPPTQGRSRWMPAAAAAAILLLLLAGGGETLANGLRATLKRIGIWSFFVREMSAEEVADYTRDFRLPKMDDKQPQTVTVQEAEREVGYRLPRVGYLPSGFQPKGAQVTDGNASQRFMAGQQEWFDVYTSKEAGRDWQMPEGHTGQLEVKGRPAVIIYGGWLWDGKQLKWERSIETSLVFEQGGRTVHITASTKLPDSELVRIAEGIE